MDENKQLDDLGNTGLADADERELTEEELGQSTRSKVEAANVSEKCDGRSTKTELD